MDSLTLSLMLTHTEGVCPQCQNPSRRVHSTYQRRLGDLPMSGKQVKLIVQIRKFFCSQAACPRKVFAQRCDTVCQPYARRLLRADGQIQAIGLYTGARSGARLCHLTGQPISASTVLRVIKKTPVATLETPKRLGIDDFAFRKGHQYGTILVDLDQHQPIDLLPDREGKTLEVWLLAHPGIELITRDRSSVYANAVTCACPDAIQVADRWHLLKNLSEAIERFIDTQRTLIKEAVHSMSQSSVNQSLNSPSFVSVDSITASEVASSAPDPQPRDKRYPIYQRVKELQRQGHGIRAVTRHVGGSRNTVKQYFQQPVFVPRAITKRTNLLTYEAYLRQRWQTGEQRITVLYEEIKAQGYNGKYTMLTAFLATYPRAPVAPVLPPVQRGATRSSHQLSRLLCQPESAWSVGERPLLTYLLEHNPVLIQVRVLSMRFKSMMTDKDGDALEGWCQEASTLVPLNGFVQGLRQDFAAVREAFTSTWSNGQTEGQRSVVTVNRLKTIKRQMYGRASFSLLRLRVITRNGTHPPN